MAFNMNPATTQIKYPFNGQLNPNEVYSSIYSQIISQDVRYPDLDDNYGFVNKFKVDGGKLGDTRLFYYSDVLKSRDWLGDNEAMNLLALERPEDPECQAIVANRYRIIKVSLDDYLTKKAWSTEGAFSAFNSTIQSMVGETKKLYEVQMLACYLGNVEGGATKSALEIDLTTATAGLTGEEKNRADGQIIARELADLIVAMKSYNRDYNDLGYMRAYSESKLMFIFNSKWVNKITKLSEPTIFHKDGLVPHLAQHVLPSYFFGEIIDGDSLASGLTVNGDGKIVIGDSYNFNTSGVIRTMEEDDFASGHKFPGEMLEVGDAFVPGKAYTEDEDIICKVITTDTVKYLGSFETSNNFVNPQSLTNSTILVWGFSNPDRLLDQPCITVRAD